MRLALIIQVLKEFLAGQVLASSAAPAFFSKLKVMPR
jgi:hypothetical protein